MIKEKKKLYLLGYDSTLQPQNEVISSVTHIASLNLGSEF